MAVSGTPNLLESFSVCCSSFEQIIYTAQRGSWGEEYGQLRLWAGDVNLRRKGKSSLDYKLRAASNLREVLMELLGDLGDALQEVIKIQQPNTATPPPILPSHLSTDQSHAGQKKFLSIQQTLTAVATDTVNVHLDTEPRITLPETSGKSEQPTNGENDSDKSCESDGEPGHDDHESSLEVLRQTVSDIIEDLSSLSTALRDPAPHDQIINPINHKLAPFPDSHDAQHVREKFPSAPEWLSCRLGRGNARRRDWIMYCKETAKQIVSGEVKREFRSQAKSKVTSSTLSTKLDSIFDDPTPQYDSDSEASDISATSYAVTISKPGDRQIGVPKPPAEFYEDMPFDCPICFCNLEDIKSMKQWKRHVFQDLKPYMCTHENCREGEILFARRRQWFQHELSAHLVYWVCNASRCRERFNSQELFTKHLETNHSNDCGKGQFAAIARLGKVTVPDSDSEALTCPFCLKCSNTKKAFRKHLGGELQKLALFVLPPGDIVDSDSEFSGDDEDESD